MSHISLILLFVSGVLNIMSNAKSIIAKYELKADNMLSPSIITLIKKYNNTINSNYKSELGVSIFYKILSNISLILAFVLLFAKR